MKLLIKILFFVFTLITTAVEAKSCIVPDIYNANLMLSANRWQFNGKERQTTGNLNYMDYGARMYDDFTGRWFVIDPLAETKPWISSYVYCLQNPLKYIDPDGLAEWEFSYKKMTVGDQTFDIPTWQRVSDVGDDIEIDFYHTNEVDEDGDQKTYVRDKQGNENIIKNGRKLLQEGVKRNADVNWWDIFSEWACGAGPIHSIFEGDHSTIKDGILKDGAYLLKYITFLNSGKIKDNPNKYFIPIISNIEAGFNMQSQMMGSYNLSFYRLGDRTLSIATDDKSKHSYYLHLPWIKNHERSSGKTKQGTTKQTYIFFAPLNFIY